MDAIEQPQRRRPLRAETGFTSDRRERRRDADGETAVAGQKLAIPTWVKEKYPDREYVFRWFADRPGRLAQAHAEDWDAIEGVNPVNATDKDGKPADHKLYVKYRDWYDGDRSPREAARKDLERQMERGKVQERGEGAGETLSEKFQYEEAAAQNRLS